MTAASPEQTLTVEAPDGAALRVSVSGSGPALLLVSGLGGSAGFWSPNVAALGRSFQVVRFDQRGIGASTRGSAACTIDQLALDCRAVLDAVGIDAAILLGHSTGGCIGQALARIAPERLRGLILSATWYRPSRYMAALFGTRRTILEQDPVSYASTAALLSYPPHWLEAHWETYQKALAGAPMTEEARGIVRERIDALIGFDASSYIASLTLPVLVLGARDDAIVPSFLQEELAAALPGCRKTMLDSGGHFFPVSRPDTFTACVAEWIGERV